MPKALVNGVNIHYQVSGQGPDLVLIHGATGNMAFWYLSSLPVLTEQYRGQAQYPTGYSRGQDFPGGLAQ